MKLRQQRLADEIRDIIGGCFHAGFMEDPRLKGVTITAVKLSPDYQVATVYFRDFTDTPVDIVSKGLIHASGLLRNKLAERLDLRRVPTLRFFYDESVEKAERIENLLKQIE